MTAEKEVVLLLIQNPPLADKNILILTARHMRS